MTHNTLSRSMSAIPMWLVQAIAVALLSGGIAWCTWASVSSWKNEQRIAVVETKVDAVKDDIAEIKSMQRMQGEDTKKILERLPRR